MVATSKSKNSKERIINTPFPVSGSLLFRAVGIIFGVYKPIDSSLNGGTFITDDGSKYSVKCNKAIAGYLREHRDLLEEPQYWTVYPRTTKYGLSFELIAIHHSTEDIDKFDTFCDYFSIQGLIVEEDYPEKTVTVEIRRNETPPQGLEKAKIWQPFLLHLHGVLNSQTNKSTLNEFWEFKVARQHHNLVIRQAYRLATATQSKKLFPAISPTSIAATANDSDEIPDIGVDNVSSTSSELILRWTKLPKATVEGDSVSFTILHNSKPLAITTPRVFYKQMVSLEQEGIPWEAVLTTKDWNINSDGSIEIYQFNLNTYKTNN